MIILDTNIVSELMRPLDERAAPAMAWIRTVALDRLCTTSITVAEIAVGIHKLPEGRRRSDFTNAAKRAFAVYFPGRILPFDESAAERFGALIGDRRRRGRHFHGFDFQILAIASTRGFAVATRDVADFSDSGVELINPWDHPAP